MSTRTRILIVAVLSAFVVGGYLMSGLGSSSEQPAAPTPSYDYNDDTVTTCEVLWLRYETEEGLWEGASRLREYEARCGEVPS